MSNLDNDTDHLLEQKLIKVETPPEPGSQSSSDLIKGILRRWYIVLFVFLIMCTIGLPAIWYLIKPLYTVSGAIRIAPIIPNILTGESNRGELSNYQMFIQTQVNMITSSRVVQRVADELAGKNLSFFEERASRPIARLKQILNGVKIKPESANILKEAILDQVITVTTNRQSELINVTTKSKNLEEAKRIVDAFISAYMAVEVASSSMDEGQKLTLLENEYKLLNEKLHSYREAIHQSAQEYGSSDMSGRYDMRLQRVASLLTELTKVETLRFNLETQVQLLEQTGGQTTKLEDLIGMRHDYISKDPTIAGMTANILKLEQELIATIQTSTNPEAKRKDALIEEMKARLDQQKEDVGKTFDDLMTVELANASSKKLMTQKAELEQTKVYENRLREMLTKEDANTIELGRKQLTIQDLEDQKSLTKEIYDQINRRIQEMEMERKCPARVSVAYYADIAAIRDKRAKYSGALLFGALFCGMGLAFLRDKADKRLRTPDDITKRINIPVIGTITSLHHTKPAHIPSHIEGEYQTIRANLGLLNRDGIPKKLVITSPGTQEGKTTFAINLATSMAKAGKKVLLIDGDLRKSDIASFLNLPKDVNGLQDTLLGIESDKAIYSISSIGLNVLSAQSCNGNEVYELISSPMAAKQIGKLSKNYDCIIIDTPPLLAFPDALVWAKIAGAVILISFAGRTTIPDLKEAKERLMQTDVRVLGTVLSNVQAAYSFYHLYDSYQAHNNYSRKKTKQAKINLLTFNKTENNKNTDSPTQSINQDNKLESKDLSHPL